MYRTPISFHKRLIQGEVPISYIVVETHMGYRAYAEKELKAIFDPAGHLLDGSFLFGGPIWSSPIVTLGSESSGVIEKSGRVISFGSFTRSLQSMKDDVLGSYQSKTLQSMSIDLDNSDDYFSKLITTEPFIGRPVKYYVGFEDESQSEHLKLFSGIITEMGVLGKMTIEADEGETGLADTFYLKRTGTYSAPLNANERLPVVYGDLTDGKISFDPAVPAGNGTWRLPCLKTTDDVFTTPVYCFAGHPVLSEADGNFISLYEDGQELNPVMWTFDESDDFEGHGAIATVTFTTPKQNAVITAKGMGKPTTPGGAVLMDNIIDIVNDFLTVENAFTSSLFESTVKATASQIFTAQGYKAAGVITEDNVIWETLTNIMGSFLGSAYIDGNGDLVLDIDINTLPQGVAEIIPKAGAYLTDTKLRRDNIINQCPANYAYNYVDNEFKSHTDDTAHADLSSQSVFGVREPNTPYQFYWCRDLTSIQKIQDLIVAKLKNPLYEVEITDITLKRLGIDIGDFIQYSAQHLYDTDSMALLNNFWKVISVKPDYAKNNIVFRALQTGYFATLAEYLGIQAPGLLDPMWILDGSVKFGRERDLTEY